MSGPTLVPFKPPESKPDQGLVEFGKDLLAEIESGDLDAVLVVKVTKEDGIVTGWAWEKSVESTQMVGGVSVLQHRLLRELGA